MVMTGFEPLVDNTNVGQLTDGQHNPATAWRAFYRNNGTASAAFKVMAVCSPIE